MPAGWDLGRQQEEVRRRSSPLANAFDLGDGDEVETLAEDITVHGQRLAILRAGGQIVDGRRRWLACRRAGIEPWFEDVDDADPAALAALVVSLNAHRRHSTLGALAIAAARCVREATGGGVPITRLATALQIRREAVHKAVRVLDHRPDLARDVAGNRMQLHDAYRQALDAARGQPTDVPARRRPGRPPVPLPPEKAPRRWARLWDQLRTTDPVAVAAHPVAPGQGELDLQTAEAVHRYLGRYINEKRRRGPGINAKTAETPGPHTR